MPIGNYRKCQRVHCPVELEELVKPVATGFVRSVPLPLFERLWKKIGLDFDLDMEALEILFMLNPEGHPIVKGTGGIRKLRFSPRGWKVGKSSGVRVYYLYLPESSLVFWLFAHAKNRADSVSAEAKSQLRAMAKEIKEMLKAPEERK